MPIFLLGVVLDGEYDGIVFWIAVRKLGNLLDGFLEINGGAKGAIAKGMVDDGGISIIMDIDLHALQPSLQILHIAFNFGVAGELVATEVGVMRGVAIVVSEGEVLLDLGRTGRVVYLLVLQEGAELVEIQCLLQA
jgi:hypothetical protein